GYVVGALREGKAHQVGALRNDGQETQVLGPERHAVKVGVGQTDALLGAQLGSPRRGADDRDVDLSGTHVDDKTTDLAVVEEYSLTGASCRQCVGESATNAQLARIDWREVLSEGENVAGMKDDALLKGRKQSHACLASSRRDESNPGRDITRVRECNRRVGVGYTRDSGHAVGI